MTRVLVVHHDIDLEDQQVDTLRRLGYDPVGCAGPSGTSCPIMRGEDCPDVAGADVLVYDVWSTTESGGSALLVKNLREMHPDIPLVLSAPGMELDWVETEGPHKVVPLVGVPTAERLDAAIKEALRGNEQPARSVSAPKA